MKKIITKNIKKIIIGILIICVAFLFVVVRYNEKIKTEVKEEINTISTEKVLGVLQQGDIIEQTFNNHLGTFSEIYIKLATYGKGSAGFGELNVKVENAKSGEILGTGIIDLRLAEDNKDYKVDLSKKVTTTQNDLLKLVIYAENVPENTQVTFWLGNEEKANDNVLYYNGQYHEYGLVLSLGRTQVDIFSKIYILACILVILLIIIEYCVFLVIDLHGIEWNFLVIATLMGLVYFMLLPEYVTPDEGRHINTAYDVSDAILRYDRENNELETEAGTFVSNALERDKYNDYMYQLIRTNKGDNNKKCTDDPVIDTPSYQYWLSGLGISIGRILHLGVARTLFLGSFANFLFYIISFFYAIKKTPLGKRILVVLGIMPMTMQQVTSYSYDCIVISLAVVYVALVLKELYSKCTKYEWVVFIISLLLLLPTKQGADFSMTGLLVLMGLKIRKENKILFKKIMKIIAIGIVLLLVYSVYNHFSKPSEGTGMIEWANAPAYSISYLITNIPRLFILIGNTIYEKMDFYFISMIGGSLGWFQVQIPITIVCLIAFILVGVSFKSEDEHLELTFNTKIAFGVISAICFACIEAGMLLGWTPIYYRSVEGVQGRYFLPFILLLLLTLKNKKLVLKTKYADFLVFGMVLLQLPIVISIMEGFA